MRNAIGLHARPAARFVRRSQRFDAEVRVAKGGSGAAPVRADSLTNIVALGARLGDTLRGERARAAGRPRWWPRCEELAGGGFGDGVEGASGGRADRTASVAGGAADGAVPPASGDVLTGVAAAAGVAIGPAHRLGGAGRAAAGAGGRRRRVANGRAWQEGRAAAPRRAGARPRGDGRPRRPCGRRDLRRPSGAARRPGADGARRSARSRAVPPPSGPGMTPPQQVAARYRQLSEPLLAERATDVLDVGRRVVGALTGADCGRGGRGGGDRRRADARRGGRARSRAGAWRSPPRAGQ